jgi:hypothetical protein
VIFFFEKSSTLLVPSQQNHQRKQTIIEEGFFLFSDFKYALSFSHHFIKRVLVRYIFVFGEDSPIAPSITKIDNLVPIEKKRPNTVKFLKDSKHWRNLLENVVSLDLEGIKAVANKVKDIIVPRDPPKSCCICEPANSIILMVQSQNYLKFTIYAGVLRDYSNFLNFEKTKDLFKVPKFIEIVADALSAYDIVYNDVDIKRDLFKYKKSIGDVVEPLSIALKEFINTNWNREFYEKLLKAADNQEYDGNSMFWFQIAAAAIILLIAGGAIYLQLTRRRRLQAMNRFMQGNQT